MQLSAVRPSNGLSASVHGAVVPLRGADGVAEAWSSRFPLRGRSGSMNLEPRRGAPARVGALRSYLDELAMGHR